MNHPRSSQEWRDYCLANLGEIQRMIDAISHRDVCGFQHNPSAMLALAEALVTIAKGIGYSESEVILLVTGLYEFALSQSEQKQIKLSLNN